jgi:hypothetical protein
MPGRTPAIAAVLVVLLNACANSPRPYSEPISGPVATAVFHNDANGPARVYLYEDAARCSRRWQTPTILPETGKRLIVTADRELALTFSFGYTASTTRIVCDATISFTPAPDERYEVRLSSNTMLQECSVGVSRVDLDTGARQPVKVRFREWHDGLNENSDFCSAVP